MPKKGDGGAVAYFAEVAPCRGEVRAEYALETQGFRAGTARRGSERGARSAFPPFLGGGWAVFECISPSIGADLFNSARHPPAKKPNDHKV